MKSHAPAPWIGVYLDGSEEAEPQAAKVFVVMGNDFPEAVFSSEAAANAFCEDMRRADMTNNVAPDGRRLSSRIHWRVYSFDIQEAH